MDLVYSNEKRLFVLLAVIATLIWLVFIVGTLGVGLLYVGLGYIAYLFAQSAFISHIRGTGVRVGEQQLPHIHARVRACCAKLGIAPEPECYVLRTDVFNALATRFLGRNYVVLYSDVVDALADRPDALDFYIGHELGHIQRKHLRWSAFLWPAKLLPVIGAAHSRAEEYTCDRYGARCCTGPEAVTSALGAIAAGNTLWKQFDATQYARQAADTRGFWMSFHELISTYPWLTKRIESATQFLAGSSYDAPRRHPFAWFLSLFVPNLGGAGASLLIAIVIVGILAAVALPAYQDYVKNSNLAITNAQVEQVRRQIEGYVVNTQAWPNDAASVGLDATQLSGAAYTIDVGEGGTVYVTVSSGDAVSVMPAVEEGTIKWSCDGDDALRAALAACNPAP